MHDVVHMCSIYAGWVCIGVTYADDWHMRMSAMQMRGIWICCAYPAFIFPPQIRKLPKAEVTNSSLCENTGSRSPRHTQETRSLDTLC